MFRLIAATTRLYFETSIITPNKPDIFNKKLTQERCCGAIFSISLFMITLGDFNRLSLSKKINLLYENGTFVMAIRYYGYKVNLYLLGNIYLEVFVNHKQSCIEKIQQLDMSHSRMKFYSDQIKLPDNI